MPSSPDTQLARTLCARLCHDLGGAVGTLAGTLDMVGPEDDDMLAIARETGAALRLRLRLYAVAWGGPAAESDAAGLAAMLAGSPASPRVRFDLDRLAPGALLPAWLVPIVLNAALLAAEALPRGGVVSLTGSAAGGLVVLPEGAKAAWPALVLALLSGDPPQEALGGGPRQVLAPLLLALLQEASWDAAFGFGPAGAPLPLLLGAR